MASILMIVAMLQYLEVFNYLATVLYQECLIMLQSLTLLQSLIMFQSPIPDDAPVPSANENSTQLQLQEYIPKITNELRRKFERRYEEGARSSLSTMA